MLQFEEDDRGHILHEEGQGTQVSESSPKYALATSSFVSLKRELLIEE